MTTGYRLIQYCGQRNARGGARNHRKGINMGTDIHGRVQIRWDKDQPYRDAGEIERERNYMAFAILAGVRNWYGFAGCKTHEPLEPIDEPRGLPADFADGVQDGYIDVYDYAFTTKEGDKIKGEYFMGDHSFSWLTLREINEWSGWDKRAQMSGILEASEFTRVETTGDTPREWSGGVWGNGVVIVSADEARAGKEHTHVRHEWSVPVDHYVRPYKAWFDYLTEKHSWLLDTDPDAVRIVFGFDS